MIFSLSPRLFFSGIFLLSVLVANAQVVPVNPLSGAKQYVRLSGQLEPSYKGSLEFTGKGTIPANVQISNWSSIIFDASCEATVESPIVFGTTPATLLSAGDITLSSVEMNGDDTIYIKKGAFHIENIIGSGAASGHGNTIVVADNAELYVADVSIDPKKGAVLLYTSGTKGNKVKVISEKDTNALSLYKVTEKDTAIVNH